MSAESVLYHSNSLGIAFSGSLQQAGFKICNLAWLSLRTRLLVMDQSRLWISEEWSHRIIESIIPFHQSLQLYFGFLARVIYPAIFFNVIQVSYAQVVFQASHYTQVQFSVGFHDELWQKPSPTSTSYCNLLHWSNKFPISVHFKAKMKVNLPL